jgi:hypothetical protein
LVWVTSAAGLRIMSIITASGHSLITTPIRIAGSAPT